MIYDIVYIYKMPWYIKWGKAILHHLPFHYYCRIIFASESILHIVFRRWKKKYFIQISFCFAFFLVDNGRVVTANESHIILYYIQNNILNCGFFFAFHCMICYLIRRYKMNPFIWASFWMNLLFFFSSFHFFYVSISLPNGIK